MKKNKFLLLVISVLFCTSLSASNVDNVSGKEEAVSLARLKEFKKAHECENAKRNALVAAAKLFVLSAQVCNQKKGENESSVSSTIPSLHLLFIASKLPFLSYNALRFAMLRSANADQDLAIQNSLATVHLQNALYGAAKIAPVTEKAAIAQSGNIVLSIKESNVGVVIEESMEKVLSKCDESIKNRIEKLFNDFEPKCIIENVFCNDYMSPFVDGLLGLHKKYLTRNISKEDKKLSQELFKIMPPKTNAPIALSLMFNVVSKCFLAKQAGVSKKDEDKIMVEMLAPIVAKLVVPVIIRP